MCIPMAVAAAAVTAAGTLVSGVQGMMAANYEGELARRNAAMEVERARDSNERGRLEARAFFRDVGQIKGQQAASMAANGIDVGFGSAARTQQDTEMLAREDATSLYSNVHERTRGFDINAANFRAEAAAARQRGRSAIVNSVFQAGSSLMGGFQQHRAMRARLGVTGG
jgi:hypothetical protein